MSRWRWTLSAALLVAAAAGTVLAVAQEGREEFPHQEHARLFPFCVGCHEGIPEGNAAAFYPDPAFCAQCHDGQREERVAWTGPMDRADNLTFSHPEHAAELASDGEGELECQACHGTPGGGRMEVRPAEAQVCLSCHGHRAESHYVDAECATCHVPLAETRFSLARLEALPVPEPHRRDDFLGELHGELAESGVARCATCHVRETCAACHVNAASVGAIAALPAAAGRLELPYVEARYPVPASHHDPAWLQAHGEGASVETCGTCHARESCLTCHLSPAPAAVAALPSREAAPAPGTTAGAARYPLPPSHREPDFLRDHGDGATVESCSTCHTRESCATCHAAPLPRVAARLPRRADQAAPGVVTTRRAPPSHASAFFATQHGSIAASDPRSCATCHSGPSFCQSCHEPLALGERTGTVRGPATGPSAGMLVTLHPVAADTPRIRPAPGARVQVPARAERRARERPGSGRPAEFHAPNYVALHGVEAYGRRLECASCHETRVFCRDCHEQVGFGTVGRLGAGFHDAQPLWLLRHGQAARQSLESCASCHGQRDCLQCHSETGAFQVSPHGPGFDPRRAADRNPQVCLVCHLGNPLERSTP